jgi:hypothetical protein
MASKKRKKEQLTESLNLRALSDQDIVQDEEVILSHQDAVMDHDPLQSYGQNLHPNLPEQLLIHDSTFNPVDINLDSSLPYSQGLTNAGA